MHVGTNKLAFNLSIVEPTKACQPALPTQVVPRGFWGHWILCLTPLLPSKHCFYASLDANRSRMESCFCRCIYPPSDKGEPQRCTSTAIASVLLSVSTIPFNWNLLECSPWNRTTHPNDVCQLIESQASVEQPNISQACVWDGKSSLYGQSTWGTEGFSRDSTKKLRDSVRNRGEILCLFGLCWKTSCSHPTLH